MKRRLTLDFPQLVFHSPSKRNICELVFVGTLAADKLIHRLPQPSGAESTESTAEVSAQKVTLKTDTVQKLLGKLMRTQGHFIVQH